MRRPAQALDGCRGRLFLWFSLRAALCLLLAAPLAACGTRGFSIEDAVPDTSLVTSSIPPRQATQADSVVRSDEATIRNAVSSALVEEVGSTGLGWANAQTGSRGAIRDIREAQRDGFLCRSYTATRESFDGVALYRGETCLGSSRQWVTRAFDKVQ